METWNRKGREGMVYIHTDGTGIGIGSTMIPPTTTTEEKRKLLTFAFYGGFWCVE